MICSSEKTMHCDNFITYKVTVNICLCHYFWSFEKKHTDTNTNSYHNMAHNWSDCVTVDLSCVGWAKLTFSSLLPVFDIYQARLSNILVNSRLVSKRFGLDSMFYSDSAFLRGISHRTHLLSCSGVTCSVVFLSPACSGVLLCSLLQLRKLEFMKITLW